jgi:hypothetical protein
MPDDVREGPPGARIYPVRPVQFFVALLLACISGAFAGCIALIVWKTLFQLPHDAGHGLVKTTAGDYLGAAPGLVLFVMAVSLGVALFGGPVAAIIGLLLLRRGQTTLSAFLIGGLLAGVAGYAALRGIFPSGNSLRDTLALDYHGGFLTGVVAGALVAGFVGHRVLVGRRPT